jgi:hypothetical protein
LKSLCDIFFVLPSGFFLLSYPVKGGVRVKSVCQFGNLSYKQGLSGFRAESYAAFFRHVQHFFAMFGYELLHGGCIRSPEFLDYASPCPAAFRYVGHGSGFMRFPLL